MVTPTWDIPSDVVLGPALAALTGPSVLDALREQLPRVDEDARSRWRQARVIEAIYHPGRYARVAYALLNDPDTPAHRAWPQGQVVYLHAPVRTPMSRRGSIVTINGLDTEAYRFPNDRRLRGLRAFTAPGAATSVWQDWIDQTGGEYRLDAGSLQRLLIRYVPEQKWIVRLRAEGTHRDTGTLRKRRVVVRSAAPEVCATLWHRHTRLHERCKQDDARFFVPAVVGADTDNGLLAVKWVHGASLVESLRARPVEEVMMGAARMLFDVHRTELTGLDVLGTEALTSRVMDASEDLAIACPTLAPRFRRIAAETCEKLARFDGARVATLHNDLHWNQLRIEGDRFALLDLERMARGDPLVDVANLSAQLRLLACRSEHAVSSSIAREWSCAWIAAWSDVSRQPMDRARLGCYGAMAALDLARGMMRHLRSGWRELATHCVDFAEAELATARVEVSG